jgi:putative pyoverdin transport system ATP-binding/permease protein
VIRRLVGHYPLGEVLLRDESGFGHEFLLFAGLSGLGNSLVLAIVNAAAGRVQTDESNTRYLVMFGIVVATFLLSQYQVMSRSAAAVERALDRIRIGIAARIARAELDGLERIGRAAIYDVIGPETTVISQAAASLMLACQAALMILFSSIYLERLSPTGFILTFVLSLIGIRMFIVKREEQARRFAATARAQNEFFGAVTHLIDGFKEMRLHGPRANAMMSRLREISAELRTIKVASESGFAEQNAYAQASFYLLIAGVVFLLPRLSPTFPAVITQATAAVLFIIGPLASLVGSIPIFARANAAAKIILELEGRLERAEIPEREGPPSRTAAPGPLVLAGVEFAYEPGDDEAGFAIAPVSLKVDPGTIVFLVGGNGSGKSTLLKVLTGLYHPQQGSMMIGGTLFTPEAAGFYRSHFSAVFSDYHLFDWLYGLDVDPARVTEELERMELGHKVRVGNGRFSTLDLSSGQRKRLALAVAILEDRPILVFDEWAADQDPGFRLKFYEEILPALRAGGRTIIAATHDERYFAVADAIVRLDAGKVVTSAR